MKISVAQRVDLWARNLMPTVSTIALTLIGAVPMGIPGLPEITPLYTIMATFYWAVYRPDLLPPAVVFFVGLLSDILIGFPVGVGALSLLAVYALTLTQRKAFLGKPFFITWFGFFVIAFAGTLLLWGGVSMISAHIVNPTSVLFQYGLTVTFFPIVAWMFVRVHRYLVGG